LILKWLLQFWRDIFYSYNVHLLKVYCAILQYKLILAIL
jgi:hypothetical protein